MFEPKRVVRFVARLPSFSFFVWKKKVAPWCLLLRSYCKNGHLGGSSGPYGFLRCLAWRPFFLPLSKNIKKHTRWFLKLNTYCKIGYFGGCLGPNEFFDFWSDCRVLSCWRKEKHPDSCCWILIVIQFVWEVLRAQKMLFLFFSVIACISFMCSTKK